MRNEFLVQKSQPMCQYRRVSITECQNTSAKFALCFSDKISQFLFYFYFFQILHINFRGFVGFVIF